MMQSSNTCKIKYERFSSFYFIRRNEDIKSESATVTCYHEISWPENKTKTMGMTEQNKSQKNGAKSLMIACEPLDEASLSRNLTTRSNHSLYCLSSFESGFCHFQ